MDFGTLIHTAQKNEQGGKKEIKYYSTKFEPPKKEQRSKSLSANIQKFLARKEEEEKQKKHEANKRRDQLLELRSKDKKAVKRVNVMLKRTKSANQSVIQDAVDADNTAVTLAGPSQPDEDDYGYVSQSAADYYNKMMEKYSKMPDEPKFQLTKKKVSTNLSSTKDRVKAALDREQEEALLPHKRKRKHKDSDGGGAGGSSSKSDDKDKDVVEKGDPYYEKKEEKPAKPKLKPAPVINFSDLLKIAEKKQFEPIVIEQKEKEDERPMTKKQRREMEKERDLRESKERREQQRNNPQLNKIPKLNGDKSKINEERPSKSNESKMPTPKMNGLNDRIPSKNQKPLDDRPKLKTLLEQKNASYSSSSGSISSSSNKVARSEQKRPQPERPSNIDKSKPSKDYKMQGKPKGQPSKDLKPKQFPPDDIKPKQFPPNDVRPKQFPPNDVRPKQFPPKDLKSKQFSPHDMQRGGPPMKQRKPLINKGRFYDDDDEEYDSEMDDFIDDGPEDEQNYSKYISEIFGYDKKKYRYMDEDVDNMETTFAQQMKEEVISTKLGIMEDLEDMKLEEEQKRKKALLMKKRR